MMGFLPAESPHFGRDFGNESLKPGQQANSRWSFQGPIAQLPDPWPTASQDTATVAPWPCVDSDDLHGLGVADRTAPAALLQPPPPTWGGRSRGSEALAPKASGRKRATSGGTAGGHSAAASPWPGSASGWPGQVDSASGWPGQADSERRIIF